MILPFATTDIARARGAFNPQALLLAASEELLAQKARLVLWLPVMTGSGIAIYFSLRFEPPVALAAVFVLMAGSILALLFPGRESCVRSFLAFLAVSAVFWASAGFTAAQLRTRYLAAPVLERELGPVIVEGRIENIDRLDRGESIRIVLSDLTIEKLDKQKTPRKIRVKLHDGQGLRGGMRVKLLVKLNPPSPPVAPGAFDFQRYSWFKQIGAVGFAYKRIEAYSENVEGSTLSLDNLRQIVAGHIAGQIASKPDASVVTALMTGELTAIPEKDMEAMRHSGLAHMLALSGMNVGVIAGFVFFTSRFLMALFPAFALRHPIKKYSAVLAFFTIYAYTFFVGANVPVFRALLMTGVVLVAVLLDRKAFSMRLVALSAFAILICAPESLVGASFQMSFSAVAALICFFEAFRSRISSLYRGAGWFRKGAIYVLGICITTVIATLSTAPFSLYHFQQLALYGVLANLLAVPIMSFLIMPAVVLSYISIPLGLGFLTLPLAGAGVEWMREIAHWTASLEGAVLLAPHWPPEGLALLAGGVLFLFLWQGYLRYAGLAAFFSGLILVYSYSQPDLLVSSSGKLAAYKSGHAVYASSRTSDRYELENWAQMYGVPMENVRKWPKEGADAQGDIVCGEQGCRLVLNGRKIGFSYEPYALLEDCGWAEILVSRHPVDKKACNSTYIIDRFDLSRKGVHSVTIQKGNIFISSVDNARGKRPWHGTASR